MQKLEIHYMAPPFSWGHMAAENYSRRFGEVGFELLPDNGKNPLKSVLESVKEDNQMGLVPIHNTENGDMETHLRLIYKALQNTDIYIGDTTELAASHVLAGTGDISDIEEVLSHPKALEQVESALDALENEYGISIKTTACKSTSDAAKQASEGRANTAAVCSPLAADAYGLQILCQLAGKENKTTFAVIGSENFWHDQYKRNPYNDPENRVTSLIIEPHENREGLLDDILRTIRDEKYNLNHLVSMTNKGPLLFYLTISGPQTEELYGLLGGLKDKLYVDVSVLGNHPKVHYTRVSKHSGERHLRVPSLLW